MKGKRGRQTFLTRMVRAWSKVEAVRRKKGKEKRHFPERNELNLVNGPHTVKQFQPRLQERGGCNSSQDGRQGTALLSSQNQSTWGPGGAGASEHRIQLPHYTNEEAEAQGSEVIGLKSQNQSLQGLGRDPCLLFASAVPSTTALFAHRDPRGHTSVTKTALWNWPPEPGLHTYPVQES